MYSVKKYRQPIMAMFGGIVCVLSARRTKLSTIVIRVNEVIIASTLGRIASSVKIATSFTGVLHSAGSSVDSPELALSIT